MARRKTPNPQTPAIDRVLARSKRLDNGCLEWQGCRGKTGYGQISVAAGATPRLARPHRVVYVHHHGPLGEGLEIDHLCRNRACVEITHLEAVTHRVNNQRAAAAKTACPKGHPRTPENVKSGRGGSRCRPCFNAARRQSRARRRAELTTGGRDA